MEAPQQPTKNEAYCLKCRDKTSMTEAVLVEDDKKNRLAGKCVVCNSATSIYVTKKK